MPSLLPTQNPMGVTLFQFILLILVISSIAYTTISVANGSMNSDTSNNFQKQVGVVSTINGIIIALMCILSFVYTRVAPYQERAYILVLLHITLFLSLMAVSIAAFQITAK
jgi:hypothetical protein